MSVNEQLYKFVGRYRIALRDDELLPDQDKFHLTQLINLCITDIPTHLHAEVYTPTCCFAVVISADKSFTIHMAFLSHNLLVKFKMGPPCNGTCYFYKLNDDKLPKNIRVSHLKDVDLPQVVEEEWCIVSNKERDALLMPPPPPRKALRNS